MVGRAGDGALPFRDRARRLPWLQAGVALLPSSARPLLSDLDGGLWQAALQGDWVSV